MTGLGFILFGLGCLVGLAGELRFLVLTYRHGTVWFFTCLFLPVISWIFFLTHFKEAWRPMLLAMAGVGVAGLGYWIGDLDFLV
jgi:hypothetical protein